MDWRVINDFDQYRIYQDGRVWSCRRKILLKAQINRDGYKHVTLYKDKDRCQHTIKIHRLVAEHFIDNPENKEMVDHIDRNKTNNMYWNLRWATRSENQRNTTVRKDSKLCEKYIGFEKSTNRFVVRVQNRNHKIHTRFKTLDEAIEYRNETCKELDLVY